MAVEDKRIQLHRQSTSSWSSTNRVLLEAEMGVDTDDNAFKIGDGSTAWNSLRYDNRSTYDTAANFASNDPTLPDEIVGVESDTGYYKVGDGSTAWSALLYKNKINYVTGTAANYTFSTTGEPMHLTFTRDATNRTITLDDDAINDGQLITIEVTGSGAGNVALATSAATVDGETAATWTWNGEGVLTLRYDHPNTNYKVVSTGIWDSGNVADSGDDINRRFQKFVQGEMTQYGDRTTPSHSYTTAGSVFESPLFVATFGLAYNNLGHVSPEIKDTSFWAAASTTTTTTASIKGYYFASLSGRTDTFRYSTIGTWR